MQESASLQPTLAEAWKLWTLAAWLLRLLTLGAEEARLLTLATDGKLANDLTEATARKRHDGCDLEPVV